jgi:creatinine amidohydrolase
MSKTKQVGAYLENLTWPEAKSRFDANAIVVIPIGARSKEHGHHLPMNTDYLLATELTARVVAELPVVAAPVVSIGYYPAFRHYPGSQHVKAETFMAVLTDLIEGFIDQDVRNIAVINTGFSTEAPLHIVSREILETHGIRLSIADIRNMGHSVDHLFEQKLGGHGDEDETSMIMAIKPEAVHLDRAQTDYGEMLTQAKTIFQRSSIFADRPGTIDHSKTGIRGDPTLASAEKGRAVLDAMAAELLDGLRALYPDITG